MRKENDLPIKQSVIGVAYYPEQDPESEWGLDLELMQDAGINLIRVGEFAWPQMQEKRGRYTLDWLERLLDQAADHGISAILCTPSASPPVWIVEKFPDLAPVLPDGRKSGFGGRRHYSVFHEGYRRSCEEMAHALAGRFGKHPSVLAWQIDNEVGTYSQIDCSPPAVAAWHHWLCTRYQSVQELNQAWNLVFWGQQVDCFEQVPPPIHGMTPFSPSLVLDYNRFMLEGMATFLLSQAKILRPLSPGREVIASCTEQVLAAIQQKQQNAGETWVTGVSMHNYPELTPQQGRVSMRLDLFRQLGGGKFFVFEQQSGSSFTTNNALDPEILKSWAMETVARGAKMVVFFHWRRFRGGCEWKHPCLIERDRKPRRTLATIRQTAGMICRALELLEGASIESRAQILVHWDSILARDRASETSFWMEIQLPDAKRHRVPMWEAETLRAAWLPLTNIGLAPEFVDESCPWDIEKPLIVPDLPLCSAELAGKLKAFCENGGMLICFPGAAHRDQYGCQTDTPPPGALRELLGISLDDYLPLSKGSGKTYDAALGEMTEGEQSSGDRPQVLVELSDGSSFRCDATHAEILHPESAEIIARYKVTDGTGNAPPAASRRKVGKGSAVYLGAPPFQSMDASTLYRFLVPSACEQESPFPRIEWKGSGQDRFIWLTNTSGGTLDLKKSAEDLLTGEEVSAISPYRWILVKDETVPQ